MKTAIELLQDLSNIGYSEETVEIIEGFKVTLKILNSKEEADAMAQLEGLEGIKFLNANKLQTLARSIIKINDIGFDTENNIKVKNVEASGDMTDERKEKLVKEALERKKKEIIDKKIDIMKEWSATIIDQLFNQYVTMVDKNEKKYQFKKV